MRKLWYVMIAFVLCSALVFTACSGDSADQSEEAVGTEAAETAVTQADIEQSILGKWITAERDGEPMTTNDKFVIDFVSDTQAYVSASIQKAGSHWLDFQETEVAISGDVVTITSNPDEHTTVVDEYTISAIDDSEFTANRSLTMTVDEEETLSVDVPVRYARVNDDYSEDILGTWEGHCTSEGSEFDDGQDHRWEYKDDGTYVYYVKEGDSWVPGDDEMNEYFVAGNLLCTRWGNDDTENREWWEITVDGDTMNWTALREGEGGSTFTATFEMNRVDNNNK